MGVTNPVNHLPRKEKSDTEERVLKGKRKRAPGVYNVSAVYLTWDLLIKAWLFNQSTMIHCCFILYFFLSNHYQLSPERGSLELTTFKRVSNDMNGTQP